MRQTDSAATPLLDVRGLGVAFGRAAAAVPVVEGVDLQVARGETVCLVGESGCGKSVTARALLGLLPSPPAVVRADWLRLGDTDLTRCTPGELRAVRGRRVGFAFQEPMVALNPVVRIGTQLAEAPRAHLGVSRREAAQRAEELLRAVGIPEPELRLRAYPHQLSGGMRQRVMLAAALSADPELLIADEPTTALDVSVQAQILALIEDLRRERSLGVLLITHDLAVVAQVAHRVVVLYAGQVVEEASAEALFACAAHPYTRGLLASLPRARRPGEDRHLPAIAGQVPTPGQWPPGCRFAPRCPLAEPACRNAPVALVAIHGGRAARCRRWKDTG